MGKLFYVEIPHLKIHLWKKSVKWVKVYVKGGSPEFVYMSKKYKQSIG